jgi:hypothetical protein
MEGVQERPYDTDANDVFLEGLESETGVIFLYCCGLM